MKKENEEVEEHIRNLQRFFDDIKSEVREKIWVRLTKENPHFRRWVLGFERGEK